MLKDVQGEIDLRQVPLKNVGIKNLRWPISMKDREKGIQSTVATISMAVDLPHDMRGTHMSRFVECLQSFGPVTPFALEHILDALKEKFSRQFFKPDEDQYKLGCLFGAGGLMGIAAAGMFTEMIASAHESALKKHTDRLVRENFGKRSRRK